MKTKLLALALSPLVLAMGCSQEDSAPAGFTVNEAAGPVAVYSPTIGQFPLPGDLFFQGTTDLTLNIPSSNPAAQAANSVDGWSTIAPITAKFTAPLNAATIVPGVTVRIFRVCVDPFTTRPTGTALGEMVAGVDYTASVSAVGSDATPAENTLVIKPLKAFPPKFDATSRAACPEGAQGGDLNKANGYVVVLTHGTTPAASGGTRVEIQTTSGEQVGPSSFYKIAKGTKCLYRQQAGDAACPVVDEGDSGNPGITPAGIEAGLEGSPAASAIKTETLRQLTNGHEQLAAGISAQVAAGLGANAPAAIDPADIILAWQFTPQSVGNVISAVDATFTGTQAAAPQSPILTDTGEDTSHEDLLDIEVTTAGQVFSGTVSLPYFLTPPSQSNQTAFLTEHWEAANEQGGETNLTFANPVPAKVLDYPVPVFSVVPGPLMADGASFPVAIVQHGIGSNRTNIVALAERLAQSGIATVAIDLPLHGLNDSGNDFIAATERNFGALTSGVQSSQAFLNVANLEVARDNTRQGIADLLALEELIGSMSLTSGEGAGEITMTFDTDNIYFVGHSLGGIVGTTFLANSDKVKAATIAMSGGGIAKLLDASLAFGGSIADGLAAQGVNEGTKTYEDFLVLTQTVVDSADPLNSAGALADTSMPIHFIEISGGALGGQNPPDIVVPNDSFAVSPFNQNIPELGLGGSRPLIDALELDRVDGATATTIADTPIRTAVQFSSGFHSSILTPSDATTGITACETFNEIGDQVAGFFASGGASLTIGDGTHARCVD